MNRKELEDYAFNLSVKNGKNEVSSFKEMKSASSADLLRYLMMESGLKKTEKRKILFAVDERDAVLVITDAPEEAIKLWAYRFNMHLPEDRKNGAFDLLIDAGFYVNIILPSLAMLGEDDDYEIVGWEKAYRLSDYRME